MYFGIDYLSTVFIIDESCFCFPLDVYVNILGNDKYGLDNKK